MKIADKNGKVTFVIRVQPRASSDEIVGEYHEGLKIRVAAPPAGGRANEALCRFFASRLNVPLAAVRIASGERSCTKRVEIQGVTASMIQALIR